MSFLGHMKGYSPVLQAIDTIDHRPAASIKEFEAYGNSLHPVARKAFNPYRWRRIITMMRGGDSIYSALEKLGLRKERASHYRRLYEQFPEHLK